MRIIILPSYGPPLFTVCSLNTTPNYTLDLSGLSASPDPQQIIWSSDGTRMYILNSNNDRLYQYTASTPFHLSTVGAPSAPISFGQQSQPAGFCFNASGNRLYIVGQSQDNVHVWSVTSSWDLTSGLSYIAAQDFDHSSEETSANGIVFNDVGTKLYIVGGSSDSVHQYPVSTPYDLSTGGSVEASFSLFGTESEPRDIKWSSDGMKFQVVGRNNQEIRQYPVSVAYDLSTAGSLDCAFDTNAATGGTLPTGMDWSADGTRLYLTDQSGGSEAAYEFVYP